MSKHVPDFVHPFRAAEGGYSIEGQLTFARMKRLLEVVENPEGSAEVALGFAMDEQRIPHVRGRIRTEVVLICQRCLEAMTVPIQIKLDLGIVESDDQAKRLPEQYDPLVVSEKPVAVAELIEDEILLALPAIPRHEGDVCKATNTAMKEEQAEGGSEKTSANPFSVLAQLKSKH